MSWTDIKWFFNYQMIAGALIGWVFFASIGMLQETFRHKGRVMLTLGPMEREEWVSETEYKRHKYVMSGFLLGMSLFAWRAFAKVDKNAKEKAEEEARIEWLENYKKRQSYEVNRQREQAP